MLGELIEGVGELPARSVWERVREVLEGGDSSGVSVRRAAAEVGCRVSDILRWVERSRECRSGDPDWVREISEVYDSRHERQLGVLEDRSWSLALNGSVRRERVQKFDEGGNLVGEVRKVVQTDSDTGVLLKFLESRGGSWRRGGEVHVKIEMPVDEAFQRFRSLESTRRLCDSSVPSIESVDIEGELGGTELGGTDG